GGALQLRERYEVRKLLHELHVDHVPARIALRSARIEVATVRIESRRVRVARPHDASDSSYTRRIGIAVIDEDLVTLGDLVAKKIAGLKITDPIPVGPSIALQVIDGIASGLALQ